MGCELLDSAAGLNQMNDLVEFVHSIDALLNAAFAKVDGEIALQGGVIHDVAFDQFALYPSAM
jgi:hypothetical protein